MLLVTVGLVLFVLGGSAKADELSDLREQVEALSARLKTLETQQVSQNVELKQQIAEVAEKKSEVALPESLKWAENIKWNGDFRYRHETIDDTSSSAKENRDRNRIRDRIGITAILDDEWDVGIRLAGGNSDSPTSTNQTLGNSGDENFSSHDFWLDRAYANWKPASWNGFKLTMGKMGMPFYKAGKNQLIWDGDLSPGGIAASQEFILGESTVAKVTGGGFWIAERAAEADTSLWGLQGMLTHNFADSTVIGGVSYYDYGNIKGTAPAGISSKGNTTSGGMFGNDYNILEFFGEYKTKIGDLPVSAYGSYVENTVASTSGDTGYLLGCTLNKAKSIGSWQFGYEYRDLEKDCVVGGLNDSDFIGGGTNGKGHKLGFKYQIAKSVQARLTYFVNEKGDTNDDYDLLQMDMVYKF